MAMEEVLTEKNFAGRLPSLHMLFRQLGGAVSNVLDQFLRLLFGSDDF